MLTLFKKIFTWWNQDTFGTRLKTIFFGKLVGTDELGNKYYESKDGKRWVIYSNTIDASKIQNQLGWQPRHQIGEGLEKTMRWYLDHQEWVEQVTSGAYRDYYKHHYGTG